MFLDSGSRDYVKQLHNELLLAVKKLRRSGKLVQSICVAIQKRRPNDKLAENLLATVTCLDQELTDANLDAQMLEPKAECLANSGPACAILVLPTSRPPASKIS
ncbi:hypothetical protein SAMN05444581_13512 [Methylocapsa palsarum]|uniref:Uncharacterized protein n=1 Tax=Methylocapsa palsarum TaxID=1612308 RepID=A0A1I4D4G2_9HYPH|nr:hypothetical protein SAMN05444581_13512 [Methylocapsa palsarum]